MIRPRMPEPNIAPAARRRERWIVLAIVLGIVAARSAIFLLFPESYFDADQAIVGLMAKHLAELRAFPVFLYGQTYMLGVAAGLAAVFVDASGGSLEPFLYVLLIWVTRDRPLLCGLVFGIGFLNREFTL